MIGALAITSSVLWAVTYLLIVRRGFLDRTCGVPLVALAFAITWEFLFAVLEPTPTLPRPVVPTWLALDTCILYQALRYPPYRGRHVSRVVLGLVCAFTVNGAFVLVVDDRDGVVSGFAVNAVMSVAFVVMGLRRKNLGGQSMYIALMKLLGSAVAVPAAYSLHGAVWALLGAMAVTVFADVVYARVLYRRLRAAGVAPWERV